MKRRNFLKLLPAIAAGAASVGVEKSVGNVDSSYSFTSPTYLVNPEWVKAHYELSTFVINGGQLLTMPDDNEQPSWEAPIRFICRENGEWERVKPFITA